MIINRKYSAIVFDLGQVLIPFDYNLFIQKVNKHKPGIGEQFIKIYNENYEIHRNFERGKIPEREFIDIMLGYLDNVIDGETFCNYWSSIFTINKELTDILPLLKKNHNLFLLSNTNSIHKKYGYQHYEFLKHFDQLILSHEVGFVKPEEGIYKAVESASGFPSEEHLFIDDIIEYVEAAKNLGWDGINFTSNKNLFEEFYKRKILNYYEQ